MVIIDGFYALWNIVFIIRQQIEVKANPYNVPVISLLQLFDSYVVKYCIVPSSAKGNSNSDIEYLNVWKGTMSKAIICPIAIPVHLAHKGNW